MNNIHTQTVERLVEQFPTCRWPEMQNVLRQAAAPHPPYWLLPVLACEAVGGQPETAQPAVLALACLQTSIILVDDLLDEDPRGAQQRLGAPAVANLASAIQALGLHVLAASPADASTRLAALETLNEMIMTTALGQDWDTRNPCDEASYWQMVQTKSSPFFGAVLQAGAIFGGAAPQIAEQMYQWGGLYGEMVQINDDLNDSMAIPASPDWRLGRACLPILFAEIVEHPERQRFQELRQRAAEASVLAEAQAILIRCGAVSYCVHQLLQRYHTAQRLLGDIPLRTDQGLKNLLEELALPIRRLLIASGLDPARLGLAA